MFSSVQPLSLVTNPTSPPQHLTPLRHGNLTILHNNSPLSPPPPPLPMPIYIPVSPICIVNNQSSVGLVVVSWGWGGLALSWWGRRGRKGGHWRVINQSVVDG